jgi:hypothetical protein
VRKIARLVVFFSLSFASLLLVSTGMRFLAIRLEWVKSLSSQPLSTLAVLIAAARWAMSFGLYGGVLLSLSYAARERIFAPAAAVCITLLALGFACGIGQGLESWENVPSAGVPTRPLGGPGLILGGSERPSSTAIVLVRGPAEPGGARVVAVPGRPMQYHAVFAGKDPLDGLPPAPFGDGSPWFLRSLAIDLRLNAENLQRLAGEGLAAFLEYAGALIFLLCSLSFVFKLSAWPLANLFLGCLAFRGILALETFFNSPEMQDVFDSFLQGRLPLTHAVPLIFCGVGLLACLYSVLVYLARKQGAYAA